MRASVRQPNADGIGTVRGHCRHTALEPGRSASGSRCPNLIGLGIVHRGHSTAAVTRPADPPVTVTVTVTVIPPHRRSCPVQARPWARISQLFAVLRPLTDDTYTPSSMPPSMQVRDLNTVWILVSDVSRQRSYDVLSTGRSGRPMPAPSSPQRITHSAHGRGNLPTPAAHS